jgi:hypothetical protein
MMVDDHGPRPPPRFGISRQNRSRFPFSRGPVLVVIMMYECARSGASLLIQRLVEV